MLKIRNSQISFGRQSRFSRVHASQGCRGGEPETALRVFWNEIMSLCPWSTLQRDWEFHHGNDQVYLRQAQASGNQPGRAVCELQWTVEILCTSGQHHSRDSREGWWPTKENNHNIKMDDLQFGWHEVNSSRWMMFHMNVVAPRYFEQEEKDFANSKYSFRRSCFSCIEKMTSPWKTTTTCQTDWQIQALYRELAVQPIIGIASYLRIITKFSLAYLDQHRILLREPLPSLIGEDKDAWMAEFLC